MRREIDGPNGKPSAEGRAHLEGQLEGIVLGWDTRQAEVIAERLEHVKSRKGTRHWDEGETKDFPKNQKCKYCDSPATKRTIHAEGMAYVPTCDEHVKKAELAVGKSEVVRVMGIVESKTLDPKYSVDRKRWTEDITKTTEAALRKAIQREATSAANYLKASGVLDIVEKRRKQAPGGTAISRIFGDKKTMNAELGRALEGSMAIVRSAAKNQMDRLEKRITDMEAQGVSMSQMQKEIRRSIGQRGQWRKALAINVTTSAVEGARNAVYAQAGNLMTKTWNAELDDRTRATHVRADGQKRAMSKRFRVGAAWLNYPCDPTGPAGETANCRCYLDYEPSDHFWSLDN